MSEQCKFKRYIWQLPVRWCHWINVLSIVTLAMTGLFIGHPFSIGRTASDFVMGWVRFVHFVAGYTFAVSLTSRIIWSFVGNEYSSWREFFPMFTARGRRRLGRMLRYYFFRTHEVPETIGHNPLAATAYTVLFCLYIGMILTGFALYAQYAPSSSLHNLLRPLYALFSNQGMRLAHHLGMWFIFGFVINHIYSAWLMDIKEHGAEISSIFSGFRFTVHREED